MERKTCQNKAGFRYTWPGRDEALICGEHVGALRNVANAMGLHLQVREANSGTCEQQVAS